MNIQSNGTTNTTGGGLSLSRGAGTPATAPAATGGGISLVKGQGISLTKEVPTLDQIVVGLGWDVNNFVGGDFDLDAQAFLLDGNDKVVSDGHFIFYNQPTSPDGAVKHTGDNRTGAGDGDDESIEVQLSRVAPEVQKILFTVTIYDAIARSQNFGGVKNAYIRFIDKATGNEVIRYDLTEDFSIETALVVGQLYRHNGEWKFKAVGAGYKDQLVDFCNRYGVRLG